MASQGPNGGGTFISDNSNGGGVSWVDPSNAAVESDYNYATAPFYITTFSEYLKITNFGFSIPGGSTINGIEMKVTRLATFDYSVRDYSVKLVKGNVISGSDYKTTDDWKMVSDTFTYGGSSDLWGLSLTDSDINSSSFGIAISCEKYGFKPNPNGHVDYVSITVHYTAGGGGSAVKSVSGVARASVKSVEGLAIASTKTIQGLS